MLMLPPAALRRLGAGLGSALETWTVESIVTLPFEELNVTVPPVPEKPSEVMPVVAVIDEALVMEMPLVAFTMNVPPSPPEAWLPPNVPPWAPLNFAEGFPQLVSNRIV